jgi:hypothetical protein
LPKGHPDPKRRDIHFRVREHALNWLPAAIAGKIHLAATSIENVISFLKVANGVEPKQVQLKRPQDPEAFEQPWSLSTGVTGMDLDDVVSEAHIERVSREEVLRVLGLQADEQGSGDPGEQS